MLLLVIAPPPGKELQESLQEIEDYKNGKVKLESYKDVKTLREKLLKTINKKIKNLF